MANSNLPQQPVPFLNFLRQLLQVHGRSLLLLLVGVVLPLLGFENLALVIWRNEGTFPWDEPILQIIHTTETPQLTTIAATLTRLGGLKGGTLIGATLTLTLLLLRRWRSATYVLITLVGNGFINRTVKALLHRTRPHLWESVAPQSDFAFPSGHAMTSMALIITLLILFWGSRWGWLILLGGSGFVLTIAWTRLYLGVHFPSDILAGWLVSLAWAIGVSVIIRPHLTQASSPDTTQLTPSEESAIVE
ncbi:MAG: phosphatase PAP2 family protein [Leptolyngbyaceae cyanobacterium bins.59]|nr:phosphatase PAP2 family protein [Leptolyngbyaceae cyanobacterium bins.59]